MTNLLQLIDNFLALSDKEQAIRQAINELKAFSDRDLDDLGLSRSNIENAVRNGRKGIDFNDYHTT